MEFKTNRLKLWVKKFFLIYLLYFILVIAANYLLLEISSSYFLSNADSFLDSRVIVPLIGAIFFTHWRSLFRDLDHPLSVQGALNRIHIQIRNTGNEPVQVEILGIKTPPNLGVILYDSLNNEISTPEIYSFRMEQNDIVRFSLKFYTKSTYTKVKENYRKKTGSNYLKPIGKLGYSFKRSDKKLSLTFSKNGKSIVRHFSISS